MQDDEFEWDDAKAVSNRRKHQVSFEAARLVFVDDFRIEEPDDDPDEQRWIATGQSEGQLLIVVYTDRADRIRIISARKASRHEQADYYDQFR